MNSTRLFLVICFACQAMAVEVAIDPYDSLIVRKILDQVGWTSVSVASVTMDIGQPVLDSAIPGTTQRVTCLNLNARIGLQKITVLPPEIGKLAELSVLTITKNSLTVLPRDLGYLRKLTTLDLSDNQLSRIPGWLSNLGSLQILRAEHNVVTQISDSLSQIRSLTKLALGGNKLADLPQWIGTLTSLQSLLLDSNAITTLPEELTAMTTPVFIDIRYNSICQPSSAVMQWLDQHCGNVDWRRSQQCLPSGGDPKPNWALYPYRVEEKSTGTVLVAATYQMLAQGSLAIFDRTSQVPAYGGIWTVKAVEIQNNVTSLMFPAAGELKIMFPYDLAKLQSSGLNEFQLNVYFVPAAGRRQRVESRIDTKLKQVTATITQFGTYVLGGSLSATTPTAAPAHTLTPHEPSWAVRQTRAAGPIELAIALAKPANVSVRVARPDGRLLSSLTTLLPAGKRRIMLTPPASDIRSGWYLVRLRLGERESSRRLMLR